ncbi:unnamed protein product [Litomosoides sigmodontis]|uniref:Thioredoxin-like fold domain-containing protein n=1 Tax=Litomosoides sigmodontis TaxID=42156 RepID=A0A3P6SY53_LITSI|nr:unnamed protein product [Litomosoides sigmodontis]
MQIMIYCLRKTATSARINIALVSNGVTTAVRGNQTILSQFSSKSSTSRIYNKRWKKDIVYLYQFSRASSSPNISPFCFKVETWLRANQLKHEVRSYWNFQPWDRYFPFVELNGEKISNSQLIVDRLQKHFNLNIHNNT